MKANRKKLMLAMARACMDTEDLQKAAEMPRPTLNNAICGKSVRPSRVMGSTDIMGICRSYIALGNVPGEEDIFCRGS